MLWYYFIEGKCALPIIALAQSKHLILVAARFK
jgi:hypothetical protein